MKRYMNKEETHLAVLAPGESSNTVDFKVYAIAMFDAEGTPIGVVADNCGVTSIDTLEDAEIQIAGHFRWDMDMFINIEPDKQTSVRELKELVEFLNEVQEQLLKGLIPTFKPVY